MTRISNGRRRPFENGHSFVRTIEISSWGKIMKVSTYEVGNAWQKNRYAFFARFNKNNKVAHFTSAQEGTTRYLHLVDSEKNPREYNLLNDKRILREVDERFRSKAGSLRRVLSNTVASQPCCFNIFSPLRFPENRALSAKFFSTLLEVEVSIDELIIEYTPTKGESIGDQSKYGGTDADVGVFYTNSLGRKGVILIEFKYIEAEFSTCTSYRKKKDIRPQCDLNKLEPERLDGDCISKSPNPLCGYLRYENWKLTCASEALSSSSLKVSESCPFRHSQNQLWRNMLLAEQINRSRNLDEFHFWVIAPEGNEALWKDKDGCVEENFRRILTPLGSKAFRRLYLDKDVVSNLEKQADTSEQSEWLSKFRNKYLIEII